MPGQTVQERIIKSEQIADLWGFNALIYGQPGTGKTYLAATAGDDPQAQRVFYVDIEGGTRSIVNRGVDVFKPENWQDLQAVYTMIATTTHPYKTIVIDSISEAQRMGLEFILGGKSQPQLQDYGQSNEQMTRMIRAYRDLAQRKGLNVIFIALAREDKDESTGVIQIRPALTPGAMTTITAAVDCVGYLQFQKLEDGKQHRVLQLTPDHRVLAKIRQPTGEGVEQLPDRIVDPSMGSILKHLRNQASKVGEIQQKAVKAK